MLRTLAFGGPESWGALWDLREAGVGFALPGDTLTRAPEIAGEAAGETWRVSTPRAELEASPVAGPAELDGGYDQLVRVHGVWRERRIDCLGRRGVREAIDPARFEQVRDVSAWFAPDLCLALVAARPRGSSSHGDDLVSATVLKDGQPLAVAEPRLSTTYDAGGAPTRASFELWLEPPAEEEGAEESAARFPWRAAGEALSALDGASAGAFEARAGLFRWHARGREGTGVYVLARLPRR